MNKTQAGQLIEAHVKPLFGFALRRCATIQDAEDVTQEIALRAYHALLHREDIADPVRYIWTVAHNVLANHYRSRSRTSYITDPSLVNTDFQSVLIEKDDISHLRQEIGHLSRTQREIIVAYYFHGRKQSEIADRMGLSLGTVKWHLFEAKKELKRNMETNRSIENLSFDPISFTGFGTEGSFGEEGSPWRFFRSRLHQNIAYALWHEDHTAAEIANMLGVSPVFLEDTLDYMTEQGYLSVQNGNYRCNILLTEAEDLLNDLSIRMYQEAAQLIAPALYDTLVKSDVWSDENLYAGAEPTSGRKNYALWALIPWCIANSLPEKAIPFKDAATLRPDGAHNIIHAIIAAPDTCPPPLYDQMDNHFSGPCWNERDGIALWQLDTCWSEKRIGESYQHEADSMLSMLQREFDADALSREEYARLVQKGLLQISGDPDGLFYAKLVPVWLRGNHIRQKLTHLTRGVYERNQTVLDALMQPYAEALLADTPTHLRTVRRYLLQNLYQSDWFIMHCLHTLVGMELLTPPTDVERRSLHTIILTD